MDPYDSDSSLEDAGDYTETGVLLGYASTEQTDDTISHLGGWPVSEYYLLLFSLK
jgi:pre-rRNA-processing protein TSR4